MNKEPKISAIVLVSRQGRCVQECLDSIQHQSYPNVELVQVENTRNLKTIGQGWNEGIERSTGDYIVLVGDDDVVHYDFISELVKHADGHDHIYSWCLVIDEDSYPMCYLQSSSGPMFPRGSLEKVGGFNEKIRRGVDVEILFRMQELGMTEVRIPQYLYAKRFCASGHTSVALSVYKRLKEMQALGREDGKMRVVKFGDGSKERLEECERAAKEMMLNA